MDAESGVKSTSAGRWMGLWFDLASDMTRAMLSVSPQQTPPEAFRQVRAAQLKAWEEYLQELMRTPEFLSLMKQWTAANVQARKQMSEFLGRLQHEFQGASRQDVDQLMLAMRHLESRLVEGVEQITDRLDALDARLAALEKHHERNGQPRAEGDSERRKKKRKRKPPTEAKE